MDKEISDFTSAIGATEPPPGSEGYKLFRQLFKRSNYFVLNGKFLVVKISRSEKPFWGVGNKFINFFNSFENYHLVLLISKREGWVFNKNEINNYINNGTWRLREKDDNYKINVPLPDSNSFVSINAFLKKI